VKAQAKNEGVFGPLCIWCGRNFDEVGTDESHVYPAMLGNIDDMVLPPGVVCRECNNHFGGEAEIALADDPQIHIQRVSARVADRRHRFREELFDARHPAVNGVAHIINVHAERQDPHTMRFHVEHTLKGIMDERYDARKLIILSRVVHKIAFESLAWFLLEHDKRMPDGTAVDLYSESFRAIRRWARFSEGRVRPFLRWPPESAVSAPAMSTVDTDIVFHGLILGDGYAAVVTGPNDQALSVLDTWAPKNVGNVIAVGRDLTGLATLRGEKESVPAGSVALQFAIVADHAAPSQAGKLDISGVFTEIFPSALPFVQPRVFLGLGVRVLGDVDGRRVYVDMQLRDPGDAVVWAQTGNIDFADGAFNPDFPNMQYFALPVDGMRFSRAGLHALRVNLAGGGSIAWPLYVRHWLDTSGLSGLLIEDPRARKG
jgi:HNH endonuclease